MNVSLPYSKARRYLTGIDWLIGAANHESRKLGAGAVSQTILDLQGKLEAPALAAVMEKVARRFPLIFGRVRRDWLNLCPYWDVPPSANRATVHITVRRLPADAIDEADQLLCDHVNTPLANPREHLRFLLVQLGSHRTRLGMLFDHRLFDAFGAEAFLRLLDETARGGLEEIAKRIHVTAPAHLDHWARRFKAGRALGEYLDEFKCRKVSSLPAPTPRVSQRVAFIHHRLTPEQSARFIRKAGEEIGIPILLPSAMARAALALQNLPQFSTGKRLAFTTMTTRLPGREWESLFFNPYAFVLFNVDPPTDGRLASSAVALRNQFFQLIKRGIPAAMHDAMVLDRIFPFSLINALQRQVNKGRICTFYFACVRETGFPCDTFLGLPVENLTHTPQAFFPPGINLCMTWHGQAFNLVLSYIESCLDRPAASNIMHAFKSTFQ